MHKNTQKKEPSDYSKSSNNQWWSREDSNLRSLATLTI